MVDRAAKQAMALPGTPGAPMESRVLDSITTTIMPKVISTPQALAKNTTMKDMMMDTASMLMVAPRGRAREEISLGTPISSAQRLLMGMVAALEQVPKAVMAAGSTDLKNFPAGYLPRNLTIPP